ncbi:hypothetical protein ABB37_01066 [Leptomonas pyrrhocoris]|uniref:Transmembrane protein n=1 Tax=Leptomonas pyrrhocoris TaxID=157538 RepID=A0A0M9G830_LEPPY|nr:hypothetical protein ABB37_01066 [Leptomonas pyrrhocoris]KPA84523.1 hypothetical protein ABB37_01066 [Leptomonas pyrrhocoris]|eukprot:XP_015662962.1 hypothetical protein ABB37_01066 [Leptomonas pyrrhocoris]
MRSARRSSVQTPSVRTSSSHLSTIEPRGVPEFDRDYARQLSTAKRGRTGSVTPSPRAGSPHETTVDELSISHFPASAAKAAAAASRIKDYVTTHVTPPQPFQHSTSPRQSENMNSDAATPKNISLHDRSANSRSTLFADEDGAVGSTSPPKPDSLNSTRRGMDVFPRDAAKLDSLHDSGLVLAVKTVVLCVAVFFVLLCAVSFVVSSDTDYIPTYFSAGGSADISAPQRSAAASPRPFPDRMIPQLNRQIALHTRHTLGQLVHVLGVVRVAHLVGRVLHCVGRLFTRVWMIVKEAILSPIAMMLPRVDVGAHPTLRNTFSNSTEGGSQGGTVVSPVARALTQLATKPVSILWRTFCCMGRLLTRSIHRFSVPLTGPNMSAAGRLRHYHPTAPVQATPRRGNTRVMSRATASFLLTIWRPLHRAWTFVVPLAGENTTPPSDNRSASLPSVTTAETRNASGAQTPFAEQARPQQPRANAPTEKETTPTTKQLTPLTKVRTTHTRRLSGELWPTLLSRHGDKLKQLAHDDLQSLFGNDAVVEDVELRSGSLVVDFAVVALSAPSEQDKSETELQRAIQSKRDAQFAKGRFTRLQAFYKEEAAKISQERGTMESAAAATAAAAAAAAKCDNLVSSCQQDCDALHQQLKEDVRTCEAVSAAAVEKCETNRVAALHDAEAVLQEHLAAEKTCQSRASECATKLADAEKLLETYEAEKRDSAATLTAAQQALAAATVGYANESEAVRQRCLMEVAKEKQSCSKQIQEVRGSLEADHAKDIELKRRECEAEALKVGEQTCAKRLTEKQGRLNEQCQSSLRHAEALCTEHLAQRVGEVNRSWTAALEELQQTMDTSATVAAQRLAACEASNAQAKTNWEAEQEDLHAACTAQVTAAQATCGEAERQAAAEGCARRLAALKEELQASCSAAVQRTELSCKAQLLNDVAAFNSSAATALAKLRETVDATKRAAEERGAACMTLREVERATCATHQQRLNASCTAQLMSAQEACERSVQERVEAERATQRQIADESWSRQVAVLTTQCDHETHRAVAEVTAKLQAQHTATLQDTKASLQQQAEQERKKTREASDKEREAFRQRYAGELRRCEAQTSSCVAERRAAQAAQEATAEESRRQLFVYLADSGEGACLHLTHGDKAGCAAERKTIEARLHALPITATPLEALSSLLFDSRSASSSSPSSAPGQLTWSFADSGLRSLTQPDRQVGKAATPWLHVTGMVVGLASAAYALFRRQRDRRLYKDTIAQLNALIDANAVTMAVRSARPPLPRRGRIGTAAAAFTDDAPASWAVAATCLEACTDAIVSWHSTSCAVLFEQESKALLQQHYGVQHSALSSISPFNSALGPQPPTSVVSASTLPLSDLDASRADTAHAVSQMHEAFVRMYYDVLEMYYVDLLNAVANRELAESQLQQTESVAARQATILHKQSAAVAQLRRALAENEKELARRGTTPGNVGCVGGAEDKLAKEERKTAAQQAMIALLEGQLQVSREELDRARGGVQTPGRTPRSEAGAESSTAKQVLSLQELADAENDGTNSSDFSNAGHPSPRRPTGASSSKSQLTPSARPGQHTDPPVSRRRTTEAQRTTPSSAMKKPTSMIRDPETTRRYHKLRWNDESGGE